MSQRQEFVQAVMHRAPGESIRGICRQAGISEKTGHKWLRRYAQGGPDALGDRSHRPVTPAHQLAPTVVAAIVDERDKHPTWGGRKLRAVLQDKRPEIVWPAASTITTVLKRHGLIIPRRRTVRERAAWAHTGLTSATAPNEVWAADFKGEFRLGTGPYCYPLTISDLCSRYVLTVHALPGTGSEGAAAEFRRVFDAYGLPRVIRTDNGVPFGAPMALGGLSALAVWWIRLGIRPERIAPGEPQQNAEHERMHRTLKHEATQPPSGSFEAQQRRFERWRRTFNEERPHESLQDARPAERYTASSRPLPRRLPPLEYPGPCELRRVDSTGVIKWQNERVFLSTVLAHEYVSVTEQADDEWAIAFGPLILGIYSASLMAFREQLAWSTRGP